MLLQQKFKVQTHIFFHIFLKCYFGDFGFVVGIVLCSFFRFSVFRLLDTACNWHVKEDESLGNGMEWSNNVTDWLTMTTTTTKTITTLNFNELFCCMLLHKYKRITWTITWWKLACIRIALTQTQTIKKFFGLLRRKYHKCHQQQSVVLNNNNTNNKA